MWFEICHDRLLLWSAGATPSSEMQTDTWHLFEMIPKIFNSHASKWEVMAFACNHWRFATNSSIPALYEMPDWHKKWE
jgi:hypothetical protein